MWCVTVKLVLIFLFSFFIHTLNRLCDNLFIHNFANKILWFSKYQCLETHSGFFSLRIAAHHPIWDIHLPLSVLAFVEAERTWNWLYVKVAHAAGTQIDSYGLQTKINCNRVNEFHFKEYVITWKALCAHGTNSIEMIDWFIK